MKKLMIMLFVVSAIAATSCKKENEVSPSKNKSIKMDEDPSIDKSNVGTWD